MLHIRFIFILLIVFAFNVYGNSFLIKGKVVDCIQQPVRFALVRLQNTNILGYTDIDGSFTIHTKNNLISQHITASKDGYLIGGTKFNGFNKSYTITLTKLPTQDNSKYKFTPSLFKTITDETTSKKEKICQDCHTRILDEWQNDKHYNSANNTSFLSIFEHGFKKDFPNSNGNCAKCHIPIAAITNNLNTDPLNLTLLEKEGINCDFCHKIKDVKLSNTNLIGIENIKFLRPHKEKELLFGSMNDVFPRSDAYNSIYEKSRYCASCHHGKFWGVLVYSEYEEWKQSSYPKDNQSCQSCHMPNSTKNDFIADKDKGGFLRNYKEIHSHNMKSTNDIDFIKNALDINVSNNILNDKFNLNISITNIGAGHHIPTSSPFRHMILNVNIVNNENIKLKQLTKYILPTWATIKGNGKVFAKIFRPVDVYSSSSTTFKHSYPEHFWRPIELEYDSRIAAKSTDTTEFIFDLNKSKHIKVNITLTYLNFFDDTIKYMNVKQKTLKLYTKDLSIRIKK